MSDRFILKQGAGYADNSSYWKVCFNVQEGRYTAVMCYGGASDASYKLYEINK